MDVAGVVWFVVTDRRLVVWLNCGGVARRSVWGACDLVTARCARGHPHFIADMLCTPPCRSSPPLPVWLAGHDHVQGWSSVAEEAMKSGTEDAAITRAGGES